MPKVKPAGKGKIESETITLRFDKVILNDLRQESEQKMESLISSRRKILILLRTCSVDKKNRMYKKCLDYI